MDIDYKINYLSPGPAFTLRRPIEPEIFYTFADKFKDLINLYEIGDTDDDDAGL